MRGDEASCSGWGPCSAWSESRSVVSDFLQPHGLYSPWNSPGQNTGVGSLSLLQGIFPTQGPNPGFPHCRQTLYQLGHKGSPAQLTQVFVECQLISESTQEGLSQKDPPDPAQPELCLLNYQAVPRAELKADSWDPQFYWSRGERCQCMSHQTWSSPLYWRTRWFSGSASPGWETTHFQEQASVGSFCSIQ